MFFIGICLFYYDTSNIIEVIKLKADKNKVVKKWRRK